jgi:hypothetical protein
MKEKQNPTYSQAGNGNDIGILLAEDSCVRQVGKREILPEILRGGASIWVITFVPFAGRPALH